MMKGKLENKAAPANKAKSMPASRAQWENSASDAAADRRVAKQNGMSLREYEGSSLDEKNDARQLKAHNAKAKARKGK